MRFNKAKTIKLAKEYAREEGAKASLFGLEILIGNSEDLINHQNPEIALYHLTVVNTLRFEIAFRKSAKWSLKPETMTAYAQTKNKKVEVYFQL